MAKTKLNADVLVIGGAAGVTAARTLHDAGLDVAVVEARERWTTIADGCAVWTIFGSGSFASGVGLGGATTRALSKFLESRPGGGRLARERTLARQFVEGFHAADPEGRIGTVGSAIATGRRAARQVRALRT